MVKLLHLYRLNIADSNNFDYSGIWETISVTGLPDYPMWKLNRIASFSNASVGETLELPQFIIERYGYAIDRVALVGTKIKD